MERLRLSPRNIRRLQVITLALIAGVGLISCNSSGGPGGTADSASLTIPTSNDPNKAWVHCTRGTGSANGFEIRLASVSEAGQLRPDLMYVRLTRVPSDFSSAGSLFQFFRWQASSTGNVSIDSTPLNFTISNPQNGQTLGSLRSSLRWSDLASETAQVGTTDATTFFNSVVLRVDLRDPGSQYDVLRAVLYGSGGSEQERTDALLPAFDANPDTYAVDTDGGARHPALRNLHPLRDKSGQGASVAQFTAWANELCVGF